MTLKRNTYEIFAKILLPLRSFANFAFFASACAAFQLPFLGLFDPKTVTGADIIKGNAAKKSGYSSAQLKNLQEQLQGKTLTFTNGKVSGVRKRDDYVSVNISFSDPNAKGLFSSSFTVKAKVTDEAGMKIAEQFDEGLKIKSLTGKVAVKGMMQVFFELTDAKIDPAK